MDTARVVLRAPNDAVLCAPNDVVLRAQEDVVLRAPNADRGSIVLGWLTKLIVFLAIAGVVAFDGLSITAARIGATDDADQAASVAAQDYRQNHDLQSAYNAALGTIVRDSETLPAKSFTIDPTTGTVHLVLHRTITTMLVRHIGPLKKYASVSVHADEAPATL